MWLDSFVHPSQTSCTSLTSRPSSEVLGEVVRVAGAGERRRRARSRRPSDGRSGCSSGSRRTMRSGPQRRRSRRAPRGSGGSPPRARRTCWRALRRGCPGSARSTQTQYAAAASVSIRRVAASSARSRDGSLEPRSPFVRTSRCTSRPAAPHFAIVPPAQISASSGCAKMPSTGPVRGAGPARLGHVGQALDPGGSGRACGPAHRCRPSVRGRSPSRPMRVRRCRGGSTACPRRTRPGTTPR